MDRNSAIGLTLIGALLVGYFYWFGSTSTPTKPAEQKQPAATVLKDTTKTTAIVTSDSLLTAKYGSLAGAMNGLDKTTKVETNDLVLTFSNKGGIVQEAELKQYKTYEQQPLKLITPTTSTFTLTSQYQGKDIDLYSLFYTESQTKKGDTTLLSFTVALPDGSNLIQTYSIPDNGYEVGYTITSNGIDKQLNGDNLTFKWLDFITPTEKSLAETRKYTTVTYYREGDGFDKLSESSNSPESVNLNEPVKWIAVKEKFFLTSLIAKDHFAAADLSITTNVADSSVVKRSEVSLKIPKANLANGKAGFKFYIGPNNYKTLSSIAPDFEKNVYLGWKPIYWVNKFVIFPVFHFLTDHISSYGLIIIVLVFLLKLVLAPLSYKSYVGMAKMKVLKPELDEIKERVGDDMTKAQQEQMKLYQQVGVNPISGCVPVLLQLPFLFSMFYLFPASIELRQKTLLWAEDLSTYDSLIHFPHIPFLGDHLSIFTLLMTAATLISTWQNNQLSSVTGPMKSMSYIMPLVFFFMLNDFSAGLTFYYFVSTVFTFGQQALIRKFVDDNKIRAILDENRKKIAAGGGSKSKFMNKLQDAMKASEEARKRSEEERKKRKK